MKPERIVSAALRAKIRDVIISLPAPAKHHQVMRRIGMEIVDISNPHMWEQGFLTSTGRFVDRGTARWIAVNAGQLKTTASKGVELFAEDLW